MMKKYIVILFTILSINTQAQKAQLYDANYDKPNLPPIYDENSEFFQKIYLQYETVIQYLETKIRDEEKQTYNKGLQDIKDISEKTLNTEKNEYEIKLQQIKNEEAEKLIETVERIKNEEKKKYETTLQQIKSEEEKKLKDAIEKEKKTYEIKLQNINDENNKILSETLEREKNDHEIKLQQLKDENDKILTEKIKKIRDDIYTFEIEKVKTDNLDRLTNELTEKLTKQITDQLTVEYENKKNEEISVIRHELEKEIYIQTNAGTERAKYIGIYLSTSILIIFIIILFIKILNYIKIRQIKIQSYKNDYLANLKTFRGDTSAFTEKINSEEDISEKNIMNNAFEKAKKQYNIEKDLIPFEQIKKDFGILDQEHNSNVNNWKAAVQSNDIDLQDSLCSNFIKNYKEFSKKAYEIWISIKNRPESEKEDISKIFISYYNILENISEQIIIDLIFDTDDTKLQNKLKNISKKYKNLAKKFKKRKF